VAMVATVRRSCTLTRTSSSGVSCRTYCLTASTACATSAFSPIATDGIVSVSAEASSASHHQRTGNRIPPNHSTGSPTNVPIAGVPCAGQETLLRLFRRPGHHLSGATRHDLRQAEPAPISPPIPAPWRHDGCTDRDRQAPGMARRTVASHRRPIRCGEHARDGGCELPATSSWRRLAEIRRPRRSKEQPATGEARAHTEYAPGSYFGRALRHRGTGVRGRSGSIRTRIRLSLASEFDRNASRDLDPVGGSLGTEQCFELGGRLYHR